LVYMVSIVVRCEVITSENQLHKLIIK